MSYTLTCWPVDLLTYKVCSRQTLVKVCWRCNLFIGLSLFGLNVPALFPCCCSVLLVTDWRLCARFILLLMTIFGNCSPASRHTCLLSNNVGNLILWKNSEDWWHILNILFVCLAAAGKKNSISTVIHVEIEGNQQKSLNLWASVFIGSLTSTQFEVSFSEDRILSISINSYIQDKHDVCLTCAVTAFRFWGNHVTAKIYISWFLSGWSATSFPCLWLHSQCVHSIHPVGNFLSLVVTGTWTCAGQRWRKEIVKNNKITFGLVQSCSQWPQLYMCLCFLSPQWWRKTLNLLTVLCPQALIAVKCWAKKEKERKCAEASSERRSSGKTKAICFKRLRIDALWTQSHLLVRSTFMAADRESAGDFFFFIFRPSPSHSPHHLHRPTLCPPVSSFAAVTRTPPPPAGFFFFCHLCHW